MRDRQLTQLFLQRFVENDLISPDGDRGPIIAQVCAALLSGALFISVMLALGHLMRPFAMPGQTAVLMLRIQCLYVMWSMTVMALVAVSAWDGLALDRRDTEILGPLPLPRRLIVRAKVSALLCVIAVFAAALNVLPALIHPVFAISRLQPTLSEVVSLVAAHLVTTTAAAVFGFAAVLGLREVLQAVLRPAWFRRVSLIVQFAMVIGLMTTLMLVPAFSHRLADRGLGQRTLNAELVPPLWFVGLHDVLSGHVWAHLPQPTLPARLASAEATRLAEYQKRRPLLRRLGLQGCVAFVVLILVTSAAYWWNNRRLPEPTNARARTRGQTGAVLDALVKGIVVRQSLARAAFSFTRRVLARSVQNRLPIAIALAVAIAFAFASLQIVGAETLPDFSERSTVFFAVQLWLITAVAAGFRHSVRIPADLRSRWLFHLLRPRTYAVYMAGARRAALVKLIIPILLVLLPLHVIGLGLRLALLHLSFGLLSALLLVDTFLLGYRRLPFASSYVPTSGMTTHAGVLLLVAVASVNTVAWLERVALTTVMGTISLFGVTLMVWAVIRAVAVWQRRNGGDIELDEAVDLPTLRFGLMD